MNFIIDELKEGIFFNFLCKTHHTLFEDTNHKRRRIGVVYKKDDEI